LKRRVISPQRLLVVAAGLGVSACAAPAPKADPPAAAVVVAPAPPPKPSVLETLNEELGRTSLSDARANAAHFRPLCDAEGYPLVGNTIQKTMGATGLTATTFCSDLRGRTTS